MSGKCAPSLSPYTRIVIVVCRSGCRYIATLWHVCQLLCITPRA